MDKLDRKISELIEDNKFDFEAYFNQILAEATYREHKRIAELKAKGFPEAVFTRGDKVSFTLEGKEYTGEVYIVDRYGTFEQNEEPSYDVMVEDYNGSKCLVKHLRQSSVRLGGCDEQ